MKRAFPQKVKPLPSSLSVDINAIGQNQKASVSGSRRSRTSAAMLGLALSMGASSILLPRHGDEAAAAEPKPAESTTAAASPSSQDMKSNAGADEANRSVFRADEIFAEHVVREGQTLWQISSLYQVDLSLITAANGLTPNTTLYVGQVVRVPGVEVAIAAPSTIGLSESSRLSQASSIPVVPPAVRVSSQFNDASEQDRQLKAEQDEALRLLQQKREQLRTSLESLSSLPAPERTSVTAGEQLPDLVATAPGTLPRSQTFGINDIKLDAPSEVSQESKLDEQLPVSIASLPSDQTDLTDSLDLGLTNPEPSTAISFNSGPMIPTSNGQASDVIMPNMNVTHEVAPGDTIASLARAYNVTPDTLVTENRIANPNFILVGQVLTIPTPSSSSVTLSEEPVSLIAAAPTTPVFSNPSTSSRSLSVSDEFQLDLGQPQRSSSDSLQLDLPAALPGAEALIVADEQAETIAAVPSETEMASQPMEFSIPPTEQSPSYLDQLLSDVVSLREQSMAGPNSTTISTASIQTEDVASEPAESDEVTLAARSTSLTSPEFQLEPVTTEQRPRVPEDAEVSDSDSTPEPDLVAVAPLGAENYSPLIEPITGRMVSPELPPLSNSDRFLPSGTEVFNGYIWPSTGTLTSGYGWRWGRMHRGIDIAAPVGTPIVAAAPGVVEFSGWNSGGYGNMVEIRHADGSMTRYAHNNRNLVQSGQSVEQGQQIAEMGSTGYSTGPHVHFEVHLPSEGTVNPMAYLSAQ
ncbi:MAG: peptidoglycan DD-metalloendopeptidase family protein [Synechococcales cyanobacterium K44_A2020_017]|nr:peptidoglycan DD-metalloendopeptidase family protein [Synechococcales cyanobacterium K32_A2020_035]MBF2094946.1 peptidoglycan DD-metalloendopeptidase family protein [Synechococcales cyanobacterium K44_A2020_017]